MSNDLEKNRNSLKLVKPLLKNKRLKLDFLKDQLEGQNQEFDRFKLIYEEKFLKKNALLEKIESISNSGSSLDVNMLSNVRHYLTEVNEDLIEASSSLRSRQQAVDKASSKLMECHVDVKLMEKYEEDKRLEFNQVLEKIEARQLEDLWLQNKMKRSTVEEN